MSRPAAVCVVLVMLSVCPAYAEVTSLHTDRQLYSVDMQISFAGTVDSSDRQKLVNLIVHDPNGRIVLMTGQYAAADNTFQVHANTDDPSQFGLKGTYTATAFLDSASAGKSVSFDFTPDGSPVEHKPESVGAPDQTPSKNHYVSSLTENVRASDLTNASEPQAEVVHEIPLGTPPGTTYVIMIAAGVAIVAFVIYRRKARSKTASPVQAEPDVEGEAGEADYAMQILKNRLAKGEITIDEFKSTKDALSEP